MAKTGQFGITPATSGGGGGGVVVITTAPQTPSTIDISGVAGNSLATWKSFTFVVAQGTIDIGGNTFGKGTYTYENLGGLAVISYDATASVDAKILIQI
jgi:hypothetical protein